MKTLHIKNTLTKLSFLIVIFIMAVLLNTAPVKGANSQAVHYEQPDINKQLISTTIHTSIIVSVDGTQRIYSVPIGKVSDVLKYLQITLSSDDVINAKLTDEVYPGQHLIVDRVTFSIYPEHKEIPYETVIQETDKLFVGEEKILPGKKGSKEYIYENKYINGELISCKCLKKEVLTYPTDRIILKGNKNITIVNDTYSPTSSILIKTKKDTKDFHLNKVKLSEKDRDLLERIVTGEFGGSYIGACLIAQSIKCAIVYDGYTSIEDVIRGMGYVGRTDIGKSQNAINAVKFIFDDNGLAVKHRLFYMCTEDYYNNNPNNFHSTQNFILQYKNVLFFDRW